jgi:hypothetical protein
MNKEPTQDQIDKAQVHSLRRAGKLAVEIAEALRLPLGRVQILLRDAPRRFRRGAGCGAEPAYESKRGAL